MTTPNNEGPPPAQSFSGSEVSTSVLKLVSEVGEIRGELKHIASKDDVTRAKLWSIISIIAMVSSLASAGLLAFRILQISSN